MSIPLLWKPGNTPRAGRTPPRTPAEDKASDASPGPNAPLSSSSSPHKGLKPDGSPLSAKALKNGLPYMREWKLRERARVSVRECVKAEEERIRSIVSAREQEERSLCKMRLIASEEARQRQRTSSEHLAVSAAHVDKDEDMGTDAAAAAAEIGIHATRNTCSAPATPDRDPADGHGEGGAGRVGGKAGGGAEELTLSSFLANRRKEAHIYDVPLEVGPQFGYAHSLQGKCPLALAICVAAGVCVCGAREAQMRGDDLQQVQPVAHQCVCAPVRLCVCC